MRKNSIFMPDYRDSRNPDVPRKGAARWLELLGANSLKLFKANIITCACLIPCGVCAYFFINVWDVLSFLGVWLCFALAGPAITALHYICIQTARGKPVWFKEDYFGCMKRERKKSVALSALVGGLWIVCLMCVRTFLAVNGSLELVPAAAFACVAFLLTGFSLFSYQQLAMVDMPFGSVLKNAVLLIFAGKERALAATLLALAVILVCVRSIGISWLLLFIGLYSLTVMTVNFIFSPVFNELFPAADAKNSEETAE